MARKSIIFATTNLSSGTGGGGVSNHELAACKKAGEVQVILSPIGKRFDKKDNFPRHISINPLDYSMPTNPFVSDYLGAQFARETVATTIFTNGNPWGLTVNTVKAMNNDDVEVIVDAPAHEVKDTIEEHTKVFGIDYNRAYPHEVDPLLSDMHREHIKNADVIICPSQYSVNALKNSGVIDGQDPDLNVQVIAHGCDLPNEVAPLPETLSVGHAGQYGPDKGGIYLVAAWNQLGLKDVELRIAGHGSGVMQELVRQQALANPNAPNAKYRFLGYLPDINVFYRNISFYVQPSVCDGFGLEVLEAMSHGRPVIVSDGCGAAELVDGTGAGFIFSKRDVNKLKEHIQYFISNPSEIAKMGAKARQIAEKYSWPAVEERYRSVIE